jgi:hypothetical protein
MVGLDYLAQYVPQTRYEPYELYASILLLLTFSSQSIPTDLYISMSGQMLTTSQRHINRLTRTVNRLQLHNDRTISGYDHTILTDLLSGNPDWVDWFIDWLRIGCLYRRRSPAFKLLFGIGNSCRICKLPMATDAVRWQKTLSAGREQAAC